jgi:hypothetical protein
MPVTRTTIRFTRESMDLIREAAKRQDSSAVLPTGVHRVLELILAAVEHVLDLSADARASY